MYKPTTIVLENALQIMRRSLDTIVLPTTMVCIFISHCNLQKPKNLFFNSTSQYCQLKQNEEQKYGVCLQIRIFKVTGSSPTLSCSHLYFISISLQISPSSPDSLRTQSNVMSELYFAFNFFFVRKRR